MLFPNISRKQNLWGGAWKKLARDLERKPGVGNWNPEGN